jgi:hypothetical protein
MLDEEMALMQAEFTLRSEFGFFTIFFVKVETPAHVLHRM